MKKVTLIATLILGLSMSTFAGDGGLFKRGETPNGNGSTTYTYASRSNRENTPMLPNHGEEGNQPAPLGSGIAVLAGLGAAYLIGKKRREE